VFEDIEKTTLMESLGVEAAADREQPALSAGGSGTSNATSKGKRKSKNKRGSKGWTTISKKADPDADAGATPPAGDGRADESEGKSTAPKEKDDDEDKEITIDTDSDSDSDSESESDDGGGKKGRKGKAKSETTIKRTSRASKRRSGVTLSGLLNALNGISSNMNGALIIMTCNNPRMLPDSLLRAGRIDAAFLVDHIKRPAAMAMASAFYETADGDELQKCERMVDAIMAHHEAAGLTAAALQSFFLRHDTLDAAIEHVGQLYVKTGFSF
jgi:SpoVK/Ycf46/Vps4 family AAA+-type ATPase